MRKFHILCLYGFRFFLYLKLMQLAIHVAKKTGRSLSFRIYNLCFNLLDIQNGSQRHTQLESTHGGCQFQQHPKFYGAGF